MLHKFFEPGDWFAPKRLGYGAGLPIAWQGWVVLVAYFGITIGLVVLLRSDPDGMWPAFTIGIALSTIALIAISRRRTRGGWRWRNGRED